MLSSNAHVHASPFTATEQSGILSRTPGLLLAARTQEELRDVLGSVVRGVYHQHTRPELFVQDPGGSLSPVDGGGGVRRGGARQLLAWLRSRLLGTGRTLSEPLSFPSHRDFQRGPVMSAPLLDADQELLGLIVVEGAPQEEDFTPSDVVVLEGIAALFSLAVHRQRRKETGRAQARIDLDRKAARRVQRRLMSSRLPADIGVTAHTGYLPALDVGGDFYSLKHLGDGMVAVAIGDVSGNGVSAALVMSRVASDIERALAAGHAPSTVLGTVNGSLSDAESETFVTASCIRLDTRSRTLRIANAGHLPMIVRRASGEVFTCGGASGMPLGMLPCHYDEEEVVLERMDIVLLMTDGLLEALDHPSGGMGIEILLELVREGPHDPHLLNERIRGAVDEARSKHVLDDVTWVGLQVAV